MKTSDFVAEAPGKLVLEHGSRGEFLAYIPDPLPPRLDLNLETISRLADATLALGELRGRGRSLPNPHLLIGPFLGREAVSSSRIEGTITDLRQLVLFEADRIEDGHADDHQEVANYVRALTYGLERLTTLPVSLRLLRELHERLMAGGRGENKRPGEFRDCQNMIGRSGQPPAQARFVPPPVSAMRTALDDFEKYVARRPSGYTSLIDLALIHYQFETIHPFLDGNGRLGRLLISLLLIERGLLTQPLLYLSSYFERNRDEYMDCLLNVSRRGAWAAWIDFFLTGVARQSRAAVGRCDALIALRDCYRESARRATNSVKTQELVDWLFVQPAFTVRHAAEHLKIASTAANRLIDRLVKLEILEEATGKQRNRVFIASGIIETMERDDEDEA